MIAFKQQCTPKTKTVLRNFIKSLRKNIQSEYFFNEKLIKKIFSIWKDWYFNPENVNGFMKYIKNEYQDSYQKYKSDFTCTSKIYQN